jgi:hypothetical protein
MWKEGVIANFGVLSSWNLLDVTEEDYENPQSD